MAEEEKKKPSIKSRVSQIKQELQNKTGKLLAIVKKIPVPKIPLDRKKIGEIRKKLSKKPPKFFLLVAIFFLVIIFLTMASRTGRKTPSPPPGREEKLEEKPTAISTFSDDEIRAQLETRTSRLQVDLEEQEKRMAEMEKKVGQVAEVSKGMKDYQANINESITSAIQKALPEIESKFRDIVASASVAPDYPTWEKVEKPLYEEDTPISIEETIPKAVAEEEMSATTPAGRIVIPTPPRRIPRKIQVLSKEEEGEEISPLITEGITPKTPYVYLPLGSFAKATLLTGAYASTDETNPLPVLISIDEAFYGPSRSRIPLKGCLAIGKAVGDINSARAIIQIVNISYVMPDGQVFETEGDLGYVVDTEGILGIPGKIVRKTGRVLTGAFATGFLSGAATGLAAAETTTLVSPETGVATQVITGDFLKAAQYKGLAQAAERMSDYYARELEKITTAIQIDTGHKINLVMQKGVIIEGFQPKTYMFGARPPSVFD